MCACEGKPDLFHVKIRRLGDGSGSHIQEKRRGGRRMPPHTAAAPINQSAIGGETGPECVSCSQKRSKAPADMFYVLMVFFSTWTSVGLRVRAGNLVYFLKGNNRPQIRCWSEASAARVSMLALCYQTLPAKADVSARWSLMTHNPVWSVA